jgi:hypothetical protein
MRLEFLIQVQNMRMTMIMGNGKQAKQTGKTQPSPTAGKVRRTTTRKPDRPADDPTMPKRSTTVEKEIRVQRAMKLVVEGKREGQIKDELCGAYGIGGWQAGRYLRHARDRLAEEHGLGPDFDMDAFRARHYAHAMSIFQESKDDKARVQALKHAGSIYGVQVPKTIAPTDPAGNRRDIAREAARGMSDEELRVMKKMRDRKRELAGAGSAGN